MREILNMAGNY